MTVISSRPPALDSQVLELVHKSRACLQQACATSDVLDRFRWAQLGALRAAAAVLAVRDGRGRRGGPRNAWAAIRRVAPELTEWAELFETTGRLLQAADRGTHIVAVREADDQVRAVEQFLALVHEQLGLMPTEPVSGFVRATTYGGR